MSYKATLKERLLPLTKKQNKETFKRWVRVTLFYKPICKNLRILSK